jgi:hypothetical protein
VLGEIPLPGAGALVTGIAGSVLGAVGAANYQILFWEPFDIFRKYYFTKELNEGARIERECKARKRP